MKTNQTLANNFFNNLLDQYINFVLVKKSHQNSDAHCTIDNKFKQVSSLNVA